MNTVEVHTVVLPLLQLPMWVQLIIAALVLLGAAVALIGSSGLLRWSNYFERVHAPAVICTLGLWSIMCASIILFSMWEHQLAWHQLLIAFFIAITVPVTNIFLMRAALFRARRAGQPVPPSPELKHINKQQLPP